MQLPMLTLLATMLTGAMPNTTAQQYPRWEQRLQQLSATDDSTPVPSMKMGAHMQMSLKAESKQTDADRSRQIVDAARRSIERYADVQSALNDGYKPFFPTGKLGEEVHYTNYRYARLEREAIDYDRPGSILYKRTAHGMEAVGVMYTAPADATPEHLDSVAPLSVATWHRHVDFCGAPKGAPLREQFGADAKFGPQGSIHTEDACKNAHGLWIPVVFGWMTHVYPTASDPKEIWGGVHMDMNARMRGVESER